MIMIEKSLNAVDQVALVKTQLLLFLSTGRVGEERKGAFLLYIEVPLLSLEVYQTLRRIVVMGVRAIKWITLSSRIP